ncbi:hypothetical protein SR1949_01770 [Sphaerospermopsis reniformis]|uniref:Uncharacterized protein n=1 Tax=Sphaerospermopsis reniformis TaxID=531300 RepID=A0A479ZRG7_9CYAN|nr:hypothetical protein [Sphaerospermopsis reniformis]GCL35085.1 hypothetical protein SR1949_01770 [Sphaerospermopsis reniformis]
MFNNKKLVKSLVKKIAQVERETLEAFRDGRVEQEPALTDRLLGKMESVLNNKRIAGIKWTVKTLTDRGGRSQESIFGADFMAALELSMDGFHIRKGFLVQSKLVEPSHTFTKREFAILKDQCKKMLDFSPASFVFLYSQQSGIVVVPATEILASRECNPHELTSKTMAAFYQEHFECFIGDPGIRRANPQGLEDLRQRYEAERLVLFYGSEGDESYDAVQLNLFE